MDRVRRGPQRDTKGQRESRLTRPFRQTIECEHCGKQTTNETAFQRWLRAHREFDSIAQGIVRFDADMILHRYKMVHDGRGSRDVQCLMFIEVKTFNAPVTKAQRDTLSLFSQFLRNRKPNMHGPRTGRHASVTSPPQAYSQLLDKWITVRTFGYHLLTFSGSCPADSGTIRWDTTEISQFDLVKLLKFERDPDHPFVAMDWRRRSGPNVSDDDGLWKEAS